jgi:hypothetical protein
VVNNIVIIIKGNKKLKDNILKNALVINFNIICPATILANNLTLKLINLAKFDTNSKIINNKTNANGKPVGKYCVNIDQCLFCIPHKYIHVKYKNAIYNGNNNEAVKVKEYVTRPATLKITIAKNKKNIKLFCSN